MLDIGWSELLVVAIVAIVVVGPKDLPKLMRTFGFYAGKVRRMAADFQRQFNEAIAESEADEVRKNLEAIKSNMGPVPDLSQPIGKPLMTGPAASSKTDFVEPPKVQAEEPPLPELLKAPAAGTKAKHASPAKTATAKTAAGKTATAKKTAAKKTPAKRPRKATKADEPVPAPEPDEPKP
ncbi:Sec-independent protein translocase protein TatB [Methyloceanibacter sp.]|uniref:Sec-independent protein translocase protein TatB n=1 Tax=Methyloceanibacter sp. TaxID=1965321 RepID=UPI002BD0D35B|nr:Sec-independent protein translocase protein TatB [Methyloceanibacter sp.]HML93488.1 Sec-independent protein translocase protein TatB [Methyloceanibacter sp.]